MLKTSTTIRHAVARNIRVQQQHLKQVRQANKPALVPPRAAPEPRLA